MQHCMAEQDNAALKFVRTTRRLNIQIAAGRPRRAAMVRHTWIAGAASSWKNV